MVETMLEKEENTLDFFLNCNSSHASIIFWLAPFFEEIGYKFPSDEMVNAMISLIARYPENERIALNVQTAIDLIHREKSGLEM